MTYKGFIGVAQIDPEAGVIRGKVVNTRDTITFQGKSVNEATKAFHESVDDYLEFCASLGEEPEKPYSGKFLVRVDPRVHRDLTVAAQRKGVSVNQLVARHLARLARRNGSTQEAKAARQSAPAIKANKPKAASGTAQPKRAKKSKAPSR